MSFAPSLASLAAVSSAAVSSAAFSSAMSNPSQRRFDFARRTAALASERGAWITRDEAIMGTAIHVELWCDDARLGQTAAAAVMEEMHRIDRAFSPHKANSELCRVNREAGRRAVPLSEEMAMLVEQALHFSALSEGAFDISYAAVGQLYDYRLGKRPDAATLAQARALVGYQGLHLDKGQRSLRFARDGMCIDLGGFAKGHAVDRAARLLQARGIGHALISAGGDSRVIGDKRGRPWSVAIRDPRRAGQHVAVLPLEDVSISTSGDYERFFDDGAERVHHLIDPSTGRSPLHVHSVTVLAADGLRSEALSKAVFVMGAQRGLAWINNMQDVDAVVVDAQGQLHASNGFLGAAQPAGAAGVSA
jgi:FAD:protein FMN transferase